MPKCQVCYKIIPPNFMVEIEGTNTKKCIFCEQGKKEVKYTDENGIPKTYTKDQCMKEYNELLNKLKHSKGISKILADGLKGEG